MRSSIQDLLRSCIKFIDIKTEKEEIKKKSFDNTFSNYFQDGVLVRIINIPNSVGVYNRLENKIIRNKNTYKFLNAFLNGHYNNEKQHKDAWLCCEYSEDNGTTWKPTRDISRNPNENRVIKPPIILRRDLQVYC